MDELEQILSCSICMEIFQSPRQLPCQHTYCTACLANFITKNKKGSIRAGFHIYCPLCRDKVGLGKKNLEATNFPLNLTIQSFLDSKELMMNMNLQQRQDNAAKSRNSIPNVFSVESKTTQTVTLNRKKKFTGIQTDKLPDLYRQKRFKANKLAQLAAESTHDTQAEFLTFHNIYIFNVYKPLFEALFEPLVTGCCSAMRTRVTITLTGFIFVLHFLAVKEYFIKRVSWFLKFTTVSLLFQLLFIRIKLDFTRSRLKHYTYAFIGYMVLHIFTVWTSDYVFFTYIWVPS